MDDTLRLIGGVIWLVVALGGTVAGWLAVVRLRRWRVAQAALLPELHGELVAARHRLLQQAFEVDRSAQEVASRLDTGAQDLAVLLLSRGLAAVTGRRVGFWGPAVARMVVARVGPSLEQDAGPDGRAPRAGAG
jgi:uncharacterized membrane protein